MQQYPNQFGGMPPMGFNQGFGSPGMMQQPMGGMMGGLPPLGGPGMPPLVPLGAMSMGGPAQTMPPVHGPAHVSMPELKIKPQEAALYDQLFHQLDPAGSGLVTGGQIKGLMTKSKLNKNILAGIWSLADKQKRKALDKADFAVALRLVALAQNGLPVSELGLKQYIDIPMPQFEGLQIGAPQQQQAPQQPPQQQAIQQVAPQQQPQSFDASFGSPVPAAAAPISEWSMTSDERAQYSSLFSQADEDQDGFVNAKEAKFFKQSGLDNKSLKQVWLLADQDKDNKLNLEEFSVAMHLTLKVRKGLTLPSTLPDVLVHKPSASTNGFDNSFAQPVIASRGASTSIDFNSPPPQKASGGFDDFGSLGSSLPGSNGHSGPSSPQMFGDSNGFAPPLSSQPVQIQPTNFFPGGSAAAFINSPEDDQEKHRIMQRTLSTAQSSLHHSADQLKGLQDQLSLFTAKTKLLIEQVNKTGMDYTHLQQLIAEEQTKIDAKKQELAKLDEDNNGILTQIETARNDLEAKKMELKDIQQQIIDAHTTIPSIKKETQEIDMQNAIIESQLQQARQTWKQVEDTKNTQSSILAARKDQAAKLLREKQEVQDMLDQAQLELAKIKNEATVVKENIPMIHSSIADMRGDLKELREVVEEERKNPTARSQVSINAHGQLELGAQKPAPPAAKPVAAAKAAASSISLGFGDDDDDFAVPDLPMPNASSNKPAPPASAPPAPASVVNKLAMFDDGDDFSISDVSLPALGSKSIAAPIAAPVASMGFDDFGDFGPGSAAPSADSFKPASDPFGASEDWGADPFASTSSTTSAAPSASSTGSGFGDDFGADPFGSSGGFGSTPPQAAKPSPPPPAAIVSPRSSAPPPPPSAMPPTPKSTTVSLTSPKDATSPLVAAPKPAAALAAFADDDGWDVPDALPSADGSAPKADWSEQAAAGHDDWGF